ncbi:MAG: hypothetical protein ACE37H_11360 [Phycisphaeraceae bacterium]
MDINKNWPIEIKHCEWAFSFQCPKVWEKLKQTKNPDVRFCETCLEEVHHVETDEEVVQAAKEGKCVAFFTLSYLDE